MTWIIIGIIVIFLIIIIFFIMGTNNSHKRSSKRFIKAIKARRAAAGDTKGNKQESKGFLEDFMRDNNLIRDVSRVEKLAKQTLFKKKESPRREDNKERYKKISPRNRSPPSQHLEKKLTKFSVQNDEIEVEWSKELANNIRGTGRGENICRAALEDIYDVEFKKIRPNWLKNPKTKRNLEIDCYGRTPNGDLIALEYQGIQHVEYEEDKSYYIKSEEEFKYQLAKDDFKKRIILRRGINFIEVHHKIPYELIGLFILDELREKGLL